MAENKLRYQVVPTYKNVPQIMFIKQFDDKESTIQYINSIYDNLHETIYHKIDNNDTMSNKEKVFESLNIDNNMHFILLGINDLEKNNKLYEIVVDTKGKKKLQTQLTNKGAEFPQYEVFSYVDTTIKKK